MNKSDSVAADENKQSSGINRTDLTSSNHGILSSASSLRYFKRKLQETEIIDVLSDLKHRVFPRPFERLYEGIQKCGLIGVEIGVGGGEHSESLLKTLDVTKLYLIDPYILYDNYHEGKAHYGVDQAPLKHAEHHALRLLAPYQNKLVWIKEQSNNGWHKITEQLDFVYIDGNHAIDFVKNDIVNYYPLIKSGGVLGGHDFYNGFQREHNGVISAVLEFCYSEGLQLRVELPDWWIVKP